MKENKWVRLLAYITGLVNQELLLQNEYLAAENRILRAHLPVGGELQNRPEFWEFLRFGYDAGMLDIVVILIHSIVTVIRLMKPGGLRAVVAESALTRHQILILNRSRNE